MTLCAITCFFNPVGYSNIQDNYFIFRENLKGVDLYTVELSFNGEFVIPDSIRIHGSQDNVMWQKERLLNILIDQLPAEYDKIAWLDADVIFQNLDWASQADKLLNSYPIIQLFDTVHLLNADGSCITYPSMMSYMHNGCDAIRSKPGFGWAARRDAIPNGLYDKHILGGGDLLMLCAWIGKWDGFMVKHTNIEWRRSFLRWAAKQFRSIKGNLGYIDGSIYHLFHGTRANRKYLERTKYLIQNNYDPDADIRIGSNGLWEWCSEKPTMHKLVRDYFHERREDETISDRVEQDGNNQSP